MTLPSYSYNNLTLSGSSSVTTGQTQTIGANLTVNTGATFTMGGGFGLTVTGTTTTNGTGTINTTGAGTNTRTFTGDVTINSTGTFDLSTANPATSYAGNITASGTTFNNGSGTVAFTASKSLQGSGNMTFAGTGTISTGITLTNSNTGTVNFSAATNCLNGASGTAVFTTGTNSTTQCASALMASGLLNPNGAGSTVEYSGGVQTVKAHNSTNNYVNIKFSGSGAKTLTVTDVSYTGNFTMACSSACSTSTVVASTAIGGALTIGANATFTAAAFIFTFTGHTLDLALNTNLTL